MILVDLYHQRCRWWPNGLVIAMATDIECSFFPNKEYCEKGSWPGVGVIDLRSSFEDRNIFLLPCLIHGGHALCHRTTGESVYECVWVFYVCMCECVWVCIVCVYVSTLCVCMSALCVCMSALCTCVSVVYVCVCVCVCACACVMYMIARTETRDSLTCNWVNKRSKACHLRDHHTIPLPHFPRLSSLVIVSHSTHKLILVRWHSRAYQPTHPGH